MTNSVMLFQQINILKNRIGGTMKFLTSFYQRAEDKNSALTLQQVLRVKGRMPIVLACVCEGSGGGEFCMRLTDWFYECALSECSRRNGPESSVLIKGLRSMAQGDFSVAGIVCAGHQFVLFYRGEQRVCLFNRRFLRPNRKELSDRTDRSGEMCVKEGIMQEEVGLLIGTEGFYRGFSEKELADCLAAGSVEKESQVRRRLEELGHFRERDKRNCDSSAAVLLMTK